MHQTCEPFSTEWACWIPHKWNAAADSLATRAMEKKEDAIFLSARWHTDKWTQADVVLMSDAGLRDWPEKPSRKLQGTGFLFLHRSSRELLAAASFFSTGRTKQADINLQELEAVHTAIELLVAVRPEKQGRWPSSVKMAFPVLNFGPLRRRWPVVKANNFREGGGSCPVLGGRLMGSG